MLLRKTSGAASVQLVFDSFQEVAADPCFQPRTGLLFMFYFRNKKLILNIKTKRKKAAELAQHEGNPGELAPDTARIIVDNIRKRKV